MTKEMEALERIGNKQIIVARNTSSLLKESLITKHDYEIIKQALEEKDKLEKENKELKELADSQDALIKKLDDFRKKYKPSYDAMKILNNVENLISIVNDGVILVGGYRVTKSQEEYETFIKAKESVEE